MAEQTPRKRGVPAKLSTLFSAQLPPNSNPPKTLWGRYLAHKRVADRNALFEIYAPWAAIIAYRMMDRRPEFFGQSNLDDMTADGCVALIGAIETFDPALCEFSAWSGTCIRRAILRGHAKLRWGGVTLSRHQNIVGHARAELIQEHGRLPLADELTAKLRGVFTNPNIYIGHAQPVSLSPASPDEQAIDPADTREAPAIFRTLGKEAMRLAMRDMAPQDKRIFKMLIRGKSDVDIARRLGVSRQRIGQRLNGVLWELRSRADLAAYLGVKPENPPAGSKRQNLPSPCKFPPAQLAG